MVCRPASRPIPPGAKTLEAGSGAWSLASSPSSSRLHYPETLSVARAPLCLPRTRPQSAWSPCVHRASVAKRVGCRVCLGAARTTRNRCRSLFDSSSGDEEYWVYLVDQANGHRQPLEWTPQAELVQEVRSARSLRSRPSKRSTELFEKLWEGSTAIMGRGVPLVPFWCGSDGACTEPAGTGDLSWLYAVPIERLRAVECRSSTGLSARMV